MRGTETKYVEKLYAVLQRKINIRDQHGELTAKKRSSPFLLPGGTHLY